ncbi:MAG: RsmB/NOP family class I SAM-dependent RNA methyltransferase [Coriobacteriia bacterium]|nr:RsmB/NOP family class I SAM-dependent RNA methyltransferase [Coriobacteriia bacterium]
MTAPARRVALAALARVRRDRAFSGAVVEQMRDSAGLSEADAALATRLTYGVLSAEGVLDEAIDRHARRALEPRVRDVLRVAAYEAIFSRTPGYALVTEAVDAVRAIRPQASGLANAVMRRVVEDAASFPWGDPAVDRDALARVTAHPRWIVDLVLEAAGEDLGRDVLYAGLEHAPMFIRLDPFQAPVEKTLEVLAPSAPMASPPDPDCLRLGAPGAAFRIAQTGWFSMDAGAQMAPIACAPQPDHLIADVGAGRGNKTVALQSLAVRAGGPAAITAVDVHPGKTARLRERLDGSGVPGVRVVTAEVGRGVSGLDAQTYDTVLLDAPCTGLGTLRRYPEKRWRIDADAPSRMAVVQADLLLSVADAVKPGGRLVYSTCSVAPSENDGVVRSFLGSDTGAAFTRAPVHDLVPQEWQRFVGADGCFQSWPLADGPDGHFVAVLQRAKE